MTQVQKTLLVLEVLICFLPVSGVLLMGAMLLPFQLLMLVTTGEPGSLLLILWVAGGICGLAAILHVLRFIFRTESSLPNPKSVLLLAVIGIAALMPLAAFSESGLSKIVTVMPVFCSIHLLYLAREYLFSPWKEKDRD